MLSRTQKDLELYAVDDKTLQVRRLLAEHGDAWVNLDQDVPKPLKDGSGFLWSSEQSGGRELELRDLSSGALLRVLVPRAEGFRKLVHLDDQNGYATYAASPEPSEQQLFRVPLLGGAAVPLVSERGYLMASFGRAHDVYVVQAFSAEQHARTLGAWHRLGSSRRVVDTLLPRLAANEAAEAIWRSDDDTLPKALDAVVQRHGRALGLGLTELKQAGENARGTLAQMAAAMGLTLPRNRLASTDAAMPPVTIAAREASVDMLAAGIQDIADALASESVPLSALLHMVLETIYRALACQRVVFCLRDASGQRLTGRFGLGDQAKLLSPRFDIPLRTVSGQPPDLFGAVCLKGVDTLVPDLQRRDVEAMLPTWFRQRVVARSMLLLPLVLRGAPLGLIYADHAMRMPLGERERVKLRELRDLAAQAFRRPGQ